MTATVSDQEIRSKVEELVQTVDLQTTKVKQFVKLLSREMGVDLTDRKVFVRDTLSECIAKMEEQEEQSEEDEGDDDSVSSGDSDEGAKRPAKGGGRGGLAAKKEISDSLAAFLGKGKTMARTEVVKSLWEYIREHDLQNPDNKREIFLDSAMKDVFGCDSFTMFTMNKYIGAHIYPFKPVDLTATPTKSPKKRKAARTGKSGSAKKTRKAGTQPPYRLSEDLALVVGAPILPRPQVVSRLWDYIKANGLQNPSDKREILCDDKLKTVMKKNKVTMFNMNQLITPHLIEKVDKDSYEHDEAGVASDES